MEKIYIISGHVSTYEQMQSVLQQPRFRKATRAMAYALASIKSITDEIPELMMPEFSEHIGIVVGTSHGELDVTTQFLDGIGNGHSARPILFQNSLHNSTLGLLTVDFKFGGPAMTVSNAQLSGEDAIDAASVFLRAGDCDLCFALGYDLYVPAVEAVRDRFYPLGLDRGEGAAAMLMASESGLKRFNKSLTPIAEMCSLVVDQIGIGGAVVDCSLVKQPFFDANGVAEFVRFVLDKSSSESLELQKPDGGQSFFKVRRL